MHTHAHAHTHARMSAHAHMVRWDHIASRDRHQLKGKINRIHALQREETKQSHNADHSHEQVIGRYVFRQGAVSAILTANGWVEHRIPLY